MATTVASAVEYVTHLLTTEELINHRGDPNQIKNQRARYIANFHTAVANAEIAVAQGMIANPRFSEIKETVARAIERANSAARIYQYCDLHHIPGKIRKTDTSPEFRAFLIEVAPLAALVVEQLKPLAVKRRLKPIEDRRERYLAPRAGLEATAQIQRALLEVTEVAYQTIYDDIVADSTRRAQAYYQFVKTTQAQRPGVTKHALYQLYFATRRRDFLGRQLILALDNLPPEQHADQIAALAKRDADEIRDQFVIKNLVKLDSIVEAKGDFESIATLGYKVSLYTLEGTFIIRFADGAHFTTKNSVVHTHSIYGKPFQQFPLRFLNVFLADGSRLSQPSEKRVNTLFCAHLVTEPCD